MKLANDNTYQQNKVLYRNADALKSSLSIYNGQEYVIFVKKENRKTWNKLYLQTFEWTFFLFSTLCGTMSDKCCFFLQTTIRAY